MGNINIPAEKSRRGTRIKEVMLERDERDMLGGDDGRMQGAETASCACKAKERETDSVSLRPEGRE